ncbi:carboxypeptidase-like regulatory domain-containing protein [bacterium]|nr:carboxypeptidase-like regulatory domain-containing protein [bacterium]MCI0606995.1 carboxypeptidase-like regulatory domain-containing protein [bacterium]
MSKIYGLTFRLAILFAGLFLASSAWAVVGSIYFQDESGDPIGEAELTIISQDGTSSELKTDKNGYANVEEGTYTIRIRHKSREMIKKGVTVRPNETSNVTFTAEKPFSYSRRPLKPGTNVSFQPQVESLDDVTRTASSSRTTLTVRDTSGNVVFSDATDEKASQALLDKTNDGLVQSLDINSYGAGVNIGLGSFGGGSALSSNKLSGFASRNSFASSAEDSSGGGSGRRLFYPYVSFMVSPADVDLEFVNPTNPAGVQQRFSGDGTILGVGVGVLFFFCDDCNWFGTGEYRYDTIVDMDMNVSPAFRANNAVVTKQDFVFDYESHLVEGIVGYNFEHFAPFGGVRGTFRTIGLDANLEADGSAAFPGFSVIGTLSFAEVLEENTIEGVAGIDFRAGHFIAGVEASFDGNNYRVRARTGFGF